MADGWGAIEPIEGAGVVYPYFTLHKLLGAPGQLTESTWDVVRANPGWDTSEMVPAGPDGEPFKEWRDEVTRRSDKSEATGRRGADLAAVRSHLMVLPVADVADYLSRKAPQLLEPYPEGSFWFLTVDPLITQRLALFRVLLNAKLAPDAFETGDERPQLNLLQEHSITAGGSFSPLLDALLLAFPPTLIGFTFEWMPHVFVLSMGFATLALEEPPPTLASLFSPRTQTRHGIQWRNQDFWNNLSSAHIETLLQWWITRLNTVYSFALDPTRFADATPRFQPTRQAAWLLTFERMLSDALVIRSNPQASGLALQQAAFDLLDKAEVLLNYGMSDTGKGFQRLLRRDEMIERLDRVWDTRLPLQVQGRFKRYTRQLYDGVYADVRATVYPNRVEDDGVYVWSDEESRLIKRGWEDYVPKLIRAVRNSAHGLIEQLETPGRHKERNIIATSSGRLPEGLPDLAALITFALIADAERFCAGTWLS